MRNCGWILFLAITLLGDVCFPQKLAITFDDLPQNGDLPPGVTRAQIARDVLKILKKRHLPPVYGFINAAKLEGNPDGAEALKLWAAKEPMGNHTYSHMNLSENTAEQFEREINENEPALELLSSGSVSGSSARDWHWFRYPYLVEGDTLEKRRAVREYLTKRGYRIAQVTMDWEDYLWNSAYARCVAKKDAKAIEQLHMSYLKTAAEYIDLDRQMAKLVYGHDVNHVLLMHLGAYSSTILPDAFDLLKKKGFEFVTLEEAERDPAYEGDPDMGSKDGGTLLDQWMDAKKLPYPQVPQKPYKELESICR